MKKLFYLAILFLPSLSWTQPDSLWTRCYVHLFTNTCKSATQTNNGGFLINGDSNAHNLTELFCVRTDSLGNELWFKQMGTPVHDIGYCAVELTDGSVIFGGSSTFFNEGPRTAMLIKLSSEGDSLWARIYGGESSSEFRYLLPLENNHFLMTGYDNNGGAGAADGWLIKADTDGEVEWEHHYGGASSEFLTDIKRTNDGGFAMIGETSSFGHGRTDFFLVKTDSEGELEWMQAYGTSANDHGRSLVQTEDGGFALFGDTDSLDRGYFYLVRIDAEGEVMWSSIYPAVGVGYGNSILSCFDGGYLISGVGLSLVVGNHDFVFLRTDEDGEIIWSGAMTSSSSDKLIESFHTPDGGFAMAGWSTTFPGSEQGDFILHRTGPDPLVCPRLIDPAYPSIFVLNSPYPNPFNSTARIDYSLPAAARVRVWLCDPLGRVVVDLVDEVDAAGRHSVTLDGARLAAGVYFCRMQAGGWTETRKAVIVK